MFSSAYGARRKAVVQNVFAWEFSPYLHLSRPRVSILRYEVAALARRSWKMADKQTFNADDFEDQCPDAEAASYQYWRVASFVDFPVTLPGGICINWYDWLDISPHQEKIYSGMLGRTGRVPQLLLKSCVVV